MEIEDKQFVADVRKIAELQKLYDQCVSAMGAEDQTAKDIKLRLDAARSRARASKSTKAQLNDAERRRNKLEKSTEVAKKNREELVKNK